MRIQLFLADDVWLGYYDPEFVKVKTLKRYTIKGSVSKYVLGEDVKAAMLAATGDLPTTGSNAWSKLQHETSSVWVEDYCLVKGEGEPGPGKTKLGYGVRTGRHFHVGVVCRIDHDFAQTGESNAWFDGQRPQMPEKMKAERWIHILNDGGGSVVVPESDIIEITSRELKDNGNPWLNFYFDITT